jgi:dipeptidyl aminopeptidase/acylaminoacyl peptidase
MDQANVPNRLVVIAGAGHGFNEEGSKTMYDSMISWFDLHLVVAQ